MQLNKGTLKHLESRMQIYKELAAKYRLTPHDVANLIAEYEAKIAELYEKESA